nr:vacuolar protein sorting associated protein 45 [Hymenolepis microstoma]
MDIYESLRVYFSKMFAIPPGIKVLIVDEETLSIVSVVMAFSEIMEKDIFLVERIKAARDSLNHLTGVFFVRPTSDNVTLISQELRSPKYASYYLFFSHALSKQSLKQLAEADIQEVVVEVQEYFADFLALSPHLFAIGRPICFVPGLDVIPEVLSRSTDAITALLLTLQWFPQIRYQQSSEPCRALAESIRSFYSRETDLFDFRKPDRLPVLLILDRRQDQITPLLTQWTYEAMIHELIGIKNNRVILPSSTKTPDKASELTLSREFDDFFKKNQYLNFGEIGQAIKDLVDNFQKVTKKVEAENAKSISDLKCLLENYPAFRKASGTVEMHVTIVSELSRIVKERSLLEISEVEQELACQNNHSTNFSRVRSLVSDPRIKNCDALRLVLLYALRYEFNHKEISILSTALAERGIPKDDVRVIGHLSDHPSSQQRVGNTGDLLSNPSVSNATNAVASITKRLVKGRKNVENVYTQHEPLLSELIRELMQGQLPESAFPTLAHGQGPSPSAYPAKQIIVYILGGVTYEEALAAHKLMSSNLGLSIILGGTTVHNSESFLDQLRSFSHSELQVEDVETVPGARSTPNRLTTSLGFGILNKGSTTSKNTRYTLLR